MSKIARSSLVVTVFTLLGLGLSFLSNVVIAANFGAGREMDVFLAATTIPFFITSILSSSLSFTFIPVFAEYREKDPAEVWTVVSSFINLSALAALAIAAAGMLFAGQLMREIAPGFTPDKLESSAGILRWLLPVILFTVVNELLSSVYYSNQKFALPSLNKLVSPLLTMAYVLVFHDSLSTKSIALAMLTASFVQAALLIAGFARNGEFGYSFALDFGHPGVIKILKLMAPLVLGMLVYKAVPLVDAYFLSGLSSGSISHIGYAGKLNGAILPIIISGISVSVFPAMSRYAAGGDMEAFKRILVKGVRMLYFIGIPFVAVLVPYGRTVTQLIFERRAFTPADTTAVYYALAVYLLALPAGAAGSVVSQAFYSLQANKTISVLAALMMLVYTALCFFLIEPLGYLAIPAAYALFTNCALLAEIVVLRRLVGGGWPASAAFFLKSSAAAGAAAALLYPLMRVSPGSASAALFCAAGFIIYLVISRSALRLEEADAVWQLAMEQLPGKFRRRSS